jgi:hypothetical protein
VAPRQRQQLALLIGAEHILARAQGSAVPDPLVQIEDPGRLHREAGVPLSATTRGGAESQSEVVADTGDSPRRLINVLIARVR